jgi:hypothetical protein
MHMNMLMMRDKTCLVYLKEMEINIIHEEIETRVNSNQLEQLATHFSLTLYSYCDPGRLSRKDMSCRISYSHQPVTVTDKQGRLK